MAVATGHPLDPASARSVVPLRVRFGETDLMGIVHHGSYVTYLEVARVEWLRRRGVTYASWAAQGLHLPVVELELHYRAPARFDDELLIETSLGELRVASLRFDYRVLRAGSGENPEPVVCAEGATRLACVNDRHALRRFSPEMIAVLTRAEEG
jgi:acyl-CoA thioester hydrolase